MRFATCLSCSFRSIVMNHFASSFTGIWQSSPIFFPLTCTYNDSLRNLYPLHSGQSVRPLYLDNNTRYCTLYRFCSTSLKKSSMPSTTELPFHNNSYCSLVRSIIALCMGKPDDLDVFIKLSLHLPSFSPFQGAMAPSYTLKRLSGITRSASIPSTRLNPSQVGHAPTGLLKEKRSGTGSSKIIPSSSKRLENCILVFSFTRRNISPSPS